MGSVSEPIVNDLKNVCQLKGLLVQDDKKVHLLHGDLHLNNLSFKR